MTTPIAIVSDTMQQEQHQPLIERKLRLLRSLLEPLSHYVSRIVSDAQSARRHRQTDRPWAFWSRLLPKIVIILREAKWHQIHDDHDEMISGLLSHLDDILAENLELADVREEICMW